MEIFAERLKELRTERGLSLSGLGDKIGVSKTAVKTMFIRIYDNNSGVDNDRWLTIALE